VVIEAWNANCGERHKSIFICENSNELSSTFSDTLPTESATPSPIDSTADSIVFANIFEH